MILTLEMNLMFCAQQFAVEINVQSELSSWLDTPILQEEVDLAFSRVRKEAAP